MKTPSFKCLLSLFTLALSIAGWADRTWIGNSGGNWSDTANWDSVSGRYLINSSATINFSGLTEIPTGLGDAPVLRIFGGSKDSPVIFTTGSSDDRSKGLTFANGAGNSAVGSGVEDNTSADGYLTIKGGYYKIGANDLVIGGHKGKNGVLTLEYGKIETHYWLVMGGYANGSTSEFNINGGEVKVGTTDGRLVIGQWSDSKATVNQTGGKVVSTQSNALEISANNAEGKYKITGGEYKGNGDALIGNGNGAHGYVEVCGGEFTITGVPKLGATSGAYGEVKVSGGTFSSNNDLLIGDGGKGKLIVSGTGVVSCEGVNHDAKWVKLGASGSEDNEIDIQTGGILKIWHIERCTSKGSAVVKFNGGTLKSLNTGNDNWSLRTLIGNVDDNHKVDASVEIGEAGGIIDVGSQYDNKISAPVYGMGTLTKKGTSSLSFTGSYFGGLSVSEGSVTTPGNQTVASGQSIFLASKCNASLSTEEVQTLSSRNLWLEDGAFIKLKGVDLDFSSTTEQKLFSVSGLRIGENNITSEEADVTGYFNVDGAVVPYAVRYKASDKTFYAIIAPVELSSGGEVSLPSWYTTNMKLIISGDTTLVVPQGTALGDVEFRDNGKIVYTLSTYTVGETASVGSIGTVTYPENETIADHIYISDGSVCAATVSNTNGALTAESREVAWIGTGTVDYTDNTQWQGGAPTSFDIAVFGNNATISSAHPVMKLTGGTTVTVAQALTIDALAIGVGGGTVDTGSYAVTVSNLKSVEGTLGFAGSGTVSISAAPAVPFGIVLSGTVTATVPYTTKLSSLSFAAGNLLYVDVSELSEATTLETPCPIALPQGYSDPNWFIAPKGKRAAFVYNYDDGIKLSSMRVPAEGESVVNVYLGGGNWCTTGNWSLNALPASADIALITLANQTIEDNVADKINVSNIVVKTAYVKFKGGNNWPKIRAREINGIDGSRIKLSCYGLGPVSGKNLEVKVDVEASNLEDPNQDCWIEGNGETSRIAFYGGFYATNSAFRVNQDVDFYGKVVCGYTSNDDNYFKDRVYFKNGSSLEVESGGTVELRGVVFESGSVVKGSGVVNMTTSGSQIAANISDALTLNLTGGTSGAALYTVLSGDNRGFTGILNSSGYHIANLASIDSGSASATWNISTDMRYTGNETGILKFGALNLTKVDWCWFYIRKNLTGLVVEVGSLNTDMTWGNEYAFGGYDGENANFEVPDARFRKVGTGTLHTYAANYPSIEVAGGVVSFEDTDGPKTAYVFGGGTFRFNSAAYADPMSKFDSANSTGPIDIDTAGHSFTWATAVMGDFDLVKRGDGTLALTGAHTYTGKTEVKGGVLILPYRDFGTQSVAVAEGAELHLDMTGVEVTENVSVPFVTTADAAVIDRVKLLGSADYTFPLTRDETSGRVSFTPTAIDQNAPNIWIGSAEGDWNFAANWSRGIPQSTHTVQINSDVVIYSSTTSSNPLQIDTLDVQCQNFTFKAYNKDASPMLKVKAVTGPGKVTLCHSGLENVNGVEMTIANDIDFDAPDDGYNSWIAANGAKVTMKGALTVLSTCGKFMMNGHNNLVIDGDLHVLSNINQDSAIDNTTINGDVLADGKFTVANCTINGNVTVNAKELRSSGCAFNGAFVIANGGQSWSKNTDTYTKSVEIQNGGILSTDSRDGTAVKVSCPVAIAGTMNLFNGSSISGDVTLASTGVLSMRVNSSVSGKISGSGAVNTADGGNYTLSGDNSAFTGTFTHDANGVLVFNSAESGSAAAVWNLNGDVSTTTLASGTLKFGALNLYNQKLWYQNSKSTMTNEVGALGRRDMQFGGNYFFGTESYDSGTNPENVTLKIVGGKLTNASYGIRKMVVAGGEMVLATPTHGDGAWGSYKNGHAGYQIDSLVVEKGATLSGTTDQTISGLTLAPGAIVKQTVTGSGTSESPYTCPTLTVNGGVDVAGVKFAVDGVDLSQVTSDDYVNLTLLSATGTGTVTGKPVAAEQIVTQGSYGWKPVVSQDAKSVVMQFGKLAAGFMLMAF